MQDLQVRRFQHLLQQQNRRRRLRYQDRLTPRQENHCLQGRWEELLLQLEQEKEGRELLREADLEVMRLDHHLHHLQGAAVLVRSGEAAAAVRVIRAEAVVLLV